MEREATGLFGRAMLRRTLGVADFLLVEKKRCTWRLLICFGVDWVERGAPMYLGEVCSLCTVTSSPLRLIDQSEPVPLYSSHPFIPDHIEHPDHLIVWFS